MPQEKVVRRKFQAQRERRERDGMDTRKIVCRRCNAVMVDAERCATYGEFWHPPGRGCINDGKRMTLHPEMRREVALFERKAVRRRSKRAARAR